MQTSHNYPDTGRLSIVSATILLVYAVAPFIQLPPWDIAFQLPGFFYAIWMIVVGGLMVSRLPTLAMKGWRIHPMWVIPLFVAAVASVAGLITDTWITLCVVGTFYLLTLPIGWYSYHARAAKENKA